MSSLGTLSSIQSLANSFQEEDYTFPVLFIGHGNPYNAIQENEFNQEWKRVADRLPKPKAILCISAHWLTKGTWVTAMEKPRTIHDFSGFSEELFSVQYPAPGSPDLANEASRIIGSTELKMDHEWGFDHGAWSVTKKMYPDADIPMIQLSIDYHENGQYHYDLARKLMPLRKKGVLTLASGNMVHNLRRVVIPESDLPMAERSNIEYGLDWAVESNELFKEKILSGDFEALVDYKKLGKAVSLSVPTPDHYYPLLYALALNSGQEETKIFNDKCVAGSISMTSVQVG